MPVVTTPLLRFRFQRALRRISVMRLLAIAVVLLWLLSPVVQAQEGGTTIDTVPPAPQGLAIYVTDLGDLIEDADEAKLRAYLAQVDESGFGQVVVLTLPDTQRELSEFSPEIMNRWGIGHKGKDDGVLILANARRITQQLSGNRIFIGSGYGVEGVLPDAVLGRILDQYAIPEFDQHRYSDGLVTTAMAVSKILQGDQTLLPPPSQPQQTELPPWVLILIIAIFISLRMMGVPIYIGRSGYRGGGFGGGGFGGGFGGGGSGGGGAGR